MFDGKMKSSTHQFIMAAGKKAGNLKTPRLAKNPKTLPAPKSAKGAGKPPTMRIGAGMPARLK